MKRMDLGVAQSLAVASQLGFVLGAAVLIGILGGAFLDDRFGTSPLFLILGAVLGLASGIYSVAQMAKFLVEHYIEKNSKAKEQ